MANVIFKFGTRDEYNALFAKDTNTLYWLYDVLELRKGADLYGTGREATDQIAGLMSPADKAKLDALIDASLTYRMTKAEKAIEDLELAIGEDGFVTIKISEEVNKVQVALNEYISSNDDALESVQDNIIAVAAKMGEVPEDKTVVQMIEEAQAAATYDDAQVKADIAANASAIKVEKKRMDTFMTLAEGETMNAALDSLKEIQDFITNEAADADILLGKVSALEAIVDGIGGEGESATVVEYVTAVIEALKIGDYAKAANLAAAVERITAIEADYLKAADKTELSDAIASEAERATAAEEANAAAAKVAQDDVDALKAKVGAVDENTTLVEMIGDSTQVAKDYIQTSITEHNENRVSHRDVRQLVDDAVGDIDARISDITEDLACWVDDIARNIPDAINAALLHAKESGEFNGSNGAAGYSPVRGVDYWTAEDKQEIIDAVIAAINA